MFSHTHSTFLFSIYNYNLKCLINKTNSSGSVIYSGYKWTQQAENSKVVLNTKQKKKQTKYKGEGTKGTKFFLSICEFWLDWTANTGYQTSKCRCCSLLQAVPLQQLWLLAFASWKNYPTRKPTFERDAKQTAPFCFQPTWQSVLLALAEAEITGFLSPTLNFHHEQFLKTWRNHMFDWFVWFKCLPAPNQTPEGLRPQFQSDRDQRVFHRRVYSWSRLSECRQWLNSLRF